MAVVCVCVCLLEGVGGVRGCACAPGRPPSEGRALIAGAAEENRSAGVKRQWAHGPGGFGLGWMRYPRTHPENKYGCFILLWQPELPCSGMLLTTSPRPYRRPTPALHSCTKKSKPLSRYSNDLIPESELLFFTSSFPLPFLQMTPHTFRIQDQEIPDPSARRTKRCACIIQNLKVSVS